MNQYPLVLYGKMQEKAAERRRLYVVQGGICCYCKLPTPYAQWTVDHKQPMSRNGEDISSNRIGACDDCNNEKSNLTENEYRTTLREGRSVKAMLRLVAQARWKKRAEAFRQQYRGYQEPRIWHGDRLVRLRVARLHTTLAWQEHLRKEHGRLLSPDELRDCDRRNNKPASSRFRANSRFKIAPLVQSVLPSSFQIPTTVPHRNVLTQPRGKQGKTLPVKITTRFPPSDYPCS